VINLSYAFQVADQLTLVGQGLAGLTPGLPISYPSDQAPMFTLRNDSMNASMNSSVNLSVTLSVTLSKDGFFSNTVPILPVTVVQANASALNPDLVTVRGMPTAKLPFRCSIVT
jgi:hypothetical protein